MKIQIAGKLFWGDDFEFYLVDPHPVMEREHWMSDTDEKFAVCQENGRVFEIVVSRPFLISRLRMGERIEIQAEEREETRDLSVEELEKDYYSLEDIANIAKMYANILP